MIKNSTLQVYNPIDLSFDHGDGVYLYTEDGTRYLDFTSGIGVTCLGHSHPALVSALKEQAGKLWHCSNLFKIKGQESVAKKITDHSFAEKVFFCNSGAEAIEAGIKALRRYFFVNGKKNKKNIICVKNAFHGRTYAAISASGQSRMLEGFLPALNGFEQVEFNNIDAIKKKIDNNTAGILIETIQGEGGITPANKKYLRDLNDIAKEKDLLLFFDEVQCGVGRTGKFLAVEWVKSLKPNIVSIAKGIGGGFPVGALLLDKKVSKTMTPGSHGSTFGGNPLGMAVADVVLNYVLKEDFLDHIRYVGYNLREKLKEKIVAKYPDLVTGVRGVGLMVGLVAKENNEKLIRLMRKQRLLTVKAGMNVIRMLPPLTLEMKHVNEAIEKIDKAFSEFNHG
ncbi:aspartate aminotransferase family protein [Alphaproteobacteria bacterium]|nr:aspartate aminotransferase family protein [Alphaproteobacteria bacterium]